VAKSADPILERLKALHPKIIDLSLGRVQDLMAALGHPEKSLPPVIHIAGTNGKGSTLATLRAVLEASGRRVHAYTSPHLVRFNERIRLAGSLIEEDFLAGLLEEVERVNAGKPVTFFEVTTAAAFLAFARVPADIVLLEVGLGGRLDATNLIDRPLASVITPVSMDHMHYLGDTLEKIAGEKAGILKKNVPAVIGLQPGAAMTVIDARIGEIGAIPFRRGREWSIARHPAGFSYKGSRHAALPIPSLPGPHQVDNAALAVATLDAARLDISDHDLNAGFGRIEWPARLQRLESGRVAALLKPDTELWLDGGHNEDAGRILAEWLSDKADKPLDLIVGMLNTKEADRFLAHLVPFVRRFRAVDVPGEQASLPATAVADAARQVGFKDVKAAADVSAALRDLAPDADRVLICGSLYLAGTVLSDNG
jgi:dihydrofolate synthase/folylpolyglutamate synthase